MLPYYLGHVSFPKYCTCKEVKNTLQYGLCDMERFLHNKLLGVFLRHSTLGERGTNSLWSWKELCVFSDSCCRCTYKQASQSPLLTVWLKQNNYTLSWALACNQNPWQTGAGELGVQDHPQLPSAFKVTLNYIRPCIKNRTKIKGYHMNTCNISKYFYIF